MQYPMLVTLPLTNYQDVVLLWQTL